MSRQPGRLKLHPDAPEALKREYRALGTLQGIAAKHRVNIFYVQQLLVEGRIPSDLSIASRLHIESKALINLKAGDCRRKHIRWFRRLTARQRDQLIDFVYHYKENE